MGILEKLGIGSKKAAKPAAEAEREPEQKKEEPKKSQPAGKVESRMDVSGEAWRILVRPLLTEKATMLTSSNKYVFVVAPRANKSEIRKSIEKGYKVSVRDVKIVSMPSKKRRYGRTTGRTSAWKKAIVSLKPGDKIPGFVESVG